MKRSLESGQADDTTDVEKGSHVQQWARTSIQDGKEKKGGGHGMGQNCRATASLVRRFQIINTCCSCCQMHKVFTNR